MIFVLFYLGLDGLLGGQNISGVLLCRRILLLILSSFLSLDLNKVTRDCSCSHCRCTTYTLRRQLLASSFAGLLLRVFGVLVVFTAAFALALVVKLFNDKLKGFELRAKNQCEAKDELCYEESCGDPA